MGINPLPRDIGPPHLVSVIFPLLNCLVLLCLFSYPVSHASLLVIHQSFNHWGHTLRGALSRPYASVGGGGAGGHRRLESQN